MFNKIARNAENIMWSLGALLFSLIALFWVLNLASKYTPSPLSGIADTLANKATPQGWD